MKAKLQNRWERIRSSYWLIPTLLSVAAGVMAVGAHQVDQAIAAGRISLGALAYGGGAGGARVILSTLAASMITVVGVAFSTIMVALVLASSEFGPRLLELFLRDRGSQLVLGSFICTFLYCILALLMVKGSDTSTFVPRFTVNLGILLSVVSVGLFIYFIHHVMRLIQAPTVVSRVGSHLDTWIDRLFTERDGDGLLAESRVPPAEGRGAGSAEPARESDPMPEWCRTNRDGEPEGPVSRAVRSERSGYLQTLDYDHLVELASDRDLLVRLSVRPGDFIRHEGELVRLHCVRLPDDPPVPEVREAFVLGDQRTPAQDPGFVVDQLVELAVRALSPGTNDPYTAITCVDRLGAALARVGRRPRPAARILGPDGRVRLVHDPIDFSELACTALDPIRQYGRSHSAVLLSLLDQIGSLAPQLERKEDLSELRWHAEKVLKSGHEGVPEEPGRETLEGRYQEVLDRIRKRTDELRSAAEETSHREEGG